MKLKQINKKTKLSPKIKIWLSSEDTEGVFGDGKWRLLKKIEQTSSIKAAAEILGISYRKAWGDLKKVEECLAIKLIEKRRGGKSGGETKLTEVGKKLLIAYSVFRSEIEKALKKAYNDYLKEIIK